MKAEVQTANPPYAPYRPVWWWRNGHISSIACGLLRRPGQDPFPVERVEIPLPDGDALAADLTMVSPDRLVWLLHGLEGDSRRPYIRRLAHRLQQAGWSTLALNFRGCSEARHQQLRSYHSGEIEDVGEAIRWMRSHSPFPCQALVGFSLGGSVALNLAGRQPAWLDDFHAGIIAVSVPLDLDASCRRLDQGFQRIYVARFLRTLKPKALARQSAFPDALDWPAVQRAASLRAFDDTFTARAHGFRDAEHYYQNCSAGQYLDDIIHPTLLINALDDPFLTPESTASIHHPRITQLRPRWGGHVAFPVGGGVQTAWYEEQILQFLSRNTR